MSFTNLTSSQKKFLLTLARQSIETGLKTKKPIFVSANKVDDFFQQYGCCFVTLTINQQLRGCVGALSPYQTLAEDVSEHAYAAAYRDFRFTPVTERELSKIKIEISLLTPQTLVTCKSEQELLEQLKPNYDGLVLDDGHNRATFLPSVWQQIPNKNNFVNELKIKAGIPSHSWPERMKAWRYSTISFSE